MKLIDADALMKVVNYTIDSVGSTCVLMNAKDFVRNLIDNQPTIDAVPVVRCKDCVYWGKNFRAADGKRGDCMNSSGAGTSAEHFCAYGERSGE